MGGKRGNGRKNHNEVEFSHELADSEDLEAVTRMKEANERAEKKQKK